MNRVRTKKEISEKEEERSTWGREEKKISQEEIKKVRWTMKGDNKRKYKEW